MAKPLVITIPLPPDTVGAGVGGKGSSRCSFLRSTLWICSALLCPSTVQQPKNRNKQPSQSNTALLINSSLLFIFELHEHSSVMSDERSHTVFLKTILKRGGATRTRPKEKQALNNQEGFGSICLSFVFIEWYVRNEKKSVGKNCYPDTNRICGRANAKKKHNAIPGRTSGKNFFIWDFLPGKTLGAAYKRLRDFSTTHIWPKKKISSNSDRLLNSALFLGTGVNPSFFLCLTLNWRNLKVLTSNFF